MAKITFQYENGDKVESFASVGESLLDVARKSNVPIDAPCSGNGSCGKCRVKLLSGELDSKITRHITEEEYAAGWRLACCSSVSGDVVVEVPDIASAYKSRMKVADLSSKEEIAIFENAKAAVEDAGIEMKNNLDIIDVVMDPPTLDDTMPDNERLVWKIREVTGVEKVRLPFTVIQSLAAVLREANFNCKCVIRKTANDIFVYDVLPGDQNVKIGGLAIDIGTTTVSAILMDLQTGEIIGKGSAGNGQIRYGADVINRIIESLKPGGKRNLQKAIIDETINPMIAEMCRSANFPASHIYRMSIASNLSLIHI